MCESGAPPLTEGKGRTIQADVTGEDSIGDHEVLSPPLKNLREIPLVHGDGKI